MAREEFRAGEAERRKERVERDIFYASERDPWHTVSIMAFGFFKKLIGGSTDYAVGVDIGTASIKMAELAWENGATRLVNYGVLDTLEYLERDNAAIQAHSLKLFEQQTIRYVRALADRAGIRTRRAVASLPAFAAFSTVLDIPPMPEKEIIPALQFKARQYIPLPISSVSLDFVRIGPQKVLLLAIPNDIIAKYKAIFKGAGFDLVALETEGVSLARALTAHDEEGAGPALVIDIGARSTGVSVAERGLLFLAGQTDFAGASLTHGVASSLSIAMRRAEDLKRERGLVSVGFGADQELSTLLFPLTDVILDEAKRLRERYSAAYGTDITRVILSGGGANLPGLQDYVRKRFDLPVSKAAPYAGVAYPLSSESILVPLGPALAVAVGAAERGFENA